MTKYELVCLFRTKEDNYAKGLGAVKALLTEAGAEFLKEEDMGDKPVAYPIKKEDRAHYHFFLVKLEGSKLLALDEQFKLKEELLKYLFVKSEK
ncbi:MAG: 30S ribosomal protein S6 [Spirochaetales bacterium]|nr:30S ribosomal protein S6 [Spirochaetales bacterium]